jgi:hypothetical protein
MKNYKIPKGKYPQGTFPRTEEMKYSHALKGRVS